MASISLKIREPDNCPTWLSYDNGARICNEIIAVLSMGNNIVVSLGNRNFTSQFLYAMVDGLYQSFADDILKDKLSFVDINDDLKPIFDNIINIRRSEIMV